MPHERDPRFLSTLYVSLCATVKRDSSIPALDVKRLLQVVLCAATSISVALNQLQDEPE